ncbi:unnamed protein product [Hydatigera taeniaeformis]|uniref:Trimethylguanosine synthase n=1 Tax=Hydatigena taeniaeformis TaxID=6205 RepID=A0A0R3X7T4_HYDTA|nr:unnamed protein product [Hydatigera taeniaeformis]
MPIEFGVPVGDKRGSSPHSVTGFVSKGINSSSASSKPRAFGSFNSSSYADFVVKARPAKISSRYYNSLAYTLSLLQNGESDSDDSDSESSSSQCLQEEQDLRPECVVPQVDISKPSQKLDDQRGIESVLEEMRLLGLPTSFGHPKFRNQPATDLDTLFLNTLERDKGSQWFAHSLTDISKMSLSSGRRCIFRYKPPSAVSSRKHVNQKPPPEHLYEDEATVSSVEKYWAQRYRLFSRFDSGIQFNREGLFSVTPEVIAVHHARRLANMLDGPPSSHTVLDLFTGIGGNCIQLAVVGFNVVTVDISESMLQMAKANARIYGVHKRITFVHADVFDFLRDTHQRFSATLASPPWGGPTYSSSTVFSLSSLTFSGESGKSDSFFNLLEAVASVTVSGGPVALFLPRSTNAGQLFELHRRFMNAALVDVIPQLECELALIHSKPKGLTVYLYYAGGIAEEGSEATFESLSESTSDSSTFYDCD